MSTEITYTDFYTYRSKEDALLIFHQRLKDAKIVFEKFHKNFSKRNCPICGSSEFSSLPKFLGCYEISLCDVCHSEYVNPAPDSTALNFYYNHCENNKTYALLNSKQKASAKVDSRVSFISKYVEEILQKQNCCNVLEIGCNSGVFTYALSEYLQQIGRKNVNYYGIDIDENAIALAQDSLEDKIGGGAILKDKITFQSLSAENLQNLQTQFDIIVHFELIEHLLDPNTFMQSIRENLSENGFCIFTTPNAASLELRALDYNKMRLLAHSLYPPMHLNAFSTQNIALFAYKNKFKLKAIDTPGKFDMSILSHSADELDDKILRKICSLDEETKAYLQYLLVYLEASSHMRIVLQK